MNYDKYSQEQFEALGVSTPEGRVLADQLQDDVCQELHKVILPKFKEIVSKLNARGHSLDPYDEIQPGEIAYRDEPSEGQCRLRLACDTVVSAGYAHVTWESTGPTGAGNKSGNLGRSEDLW